jgi:hypothetical protein
MESTTTLHSDVSFQPSTPNESSSVFPPSEPNLVNAYSPANTISSDLLTADLASVRWLDLLASDAIQANKGFSRATSPVGENPSRPPGAEGLTAPPSGSNHVTQDETARLNGLEARSWQLAEDIVLNDFEARIFRNFVERAALWVSDTQDCVLLSCLYGTKSILSWMSSTHLIISQYTQRALQ